MVLRSSVACTLLVGCIGLCAIIAVFSPPGTSFGLEPASSPSPAAEQTTLDLQAILDQRVSGQPGVGIILGVVDDSGSIAIYNAGETGSSQRLDDHTLLR